MRSLLNHVKPVVGFAPAACTSVAGDYVSLKKYGRVAIVIQLDVTIGTGSGALTLTQAKDVSGTDAKALAFDKIYVNSDIAASDTLVETAVVDNTVDIGGATKKMVYVVEVDARQLDIENGFTAVRANIATISNANVSIAYLMFNGRYFGEVDNQPSAITD